MHAELTPEEAEVAIRTALTASPRPFVVVDFDETLWLRNSTEEYLRSLRPRWLAYLILIALDILRPWRFLAGDRREHVYRDWIRVLVCTVAMPWSLLIWRRQAPGNAARWANRRLLSLAESRPTELNVASLGVDVVVEPLLRHIDPGAKLWAAGTLWSGHRIRHLGKKAWIEQRHGSTALTDALVITDSDADADLLGSCRTPILVKWPEAEYRPAMADAYIPFLYTQRAKRPGENYMLYGVLLEDVVLLWLAFAWLMPSPLLGALGLLVLHLSFWAVYEIGYVENDTYAVKHETKPKTFAVAGSYADRVTPWKAWLVSAVLGGAGVGILAASNAESLTTSGVVGDWPTLTLLPFAVWMAFVAASRLAFWLYNRLDVQTRGHFYVVLQLFRSIGYAVLIKTNWVGVVILLSLALARWVKYLVYRSAGKTFAEDQRFLTLMFFLLLACGGLAAESSVFIGLQALVALAWFAAYAHRRLREIARQLQIN
jgi:hypothetical protein